MLLPRPIPPPFLLPARGARRLYRTLQHIEGPRVLKYEDPGTEPRPEEKAIKKSSHRIKHGSFKTRRAENTRFNAKHVSLTKTAYIATQNTRAYSKTRNLNTSEDGTVLDSKPPLAPKKGPITKQLDTSMKAERWATAADPQHLGTSQSNSELEDSKAKATGKQSDTGGDGIQEAKHQSQAQGELVGDPGPSGSGSGFDGQWKSLKKQRWNASNSFKPVQSTVEMFEGSIEGSDSAIKTPSTGNGPWNDQKVKGITHDDAPSELKVNSQDKFENTAVLLPNEFRGGKSGIVNELGNGHSQAFSDNVLGISSAQGSLPEVQLAPSSGPTAHSNLPIKKPSSRGRKAQASRITNSSLKKRIVHGSLTDVELDHIKMGFASNEIQKLAKKHGIHPYNPEEIAHIQSSTSIDMSRSNEESTYKSENTHIADDLPFKHRQQQGSEYRTQEVLKDIVVDLRDLPQKGNSSITGPYREVLNRYANKQQSQSSNAQRPISLYEEFFPEHKEISTPSPGPKKMVIQPFEWNKGLIGRWDHFNTKAGLEKYPPVKTEINVSNAPDSEAYEVEKAYQDILQPVVVVLDGASPNLEESDFFRITPKGTHIEGWTSGIIKVIQSREALTLEPLAKYWILFTSEVAALAYIDQTIRLHDLAQKNVGGIMLPSTVITKSTSEEDLQSSLRSFSLIPGQHKLDIAKLRTPYQLGEAHMIKHSGPKHLKDLQPNEEGIVVFALSSGVATHREIKDVLDKDGRARNMLWDLVEDIGIQELDRLRDMRQRVVQRSIKFGTTDTERMPYTAPSRFVLTFKDRYEARRFVREWHRRPFPQPSLHGTDEELPIVLAEYIW